MSNNRMIRLKGKGVSIKFKEIDLEISGAAAASFEGIDPTTGNTTSNTGSGTGNSGAGTSPREIIDVYKPTYDVGNGKVIYDAGSTQNNTPFEIYLKFPEQICDYPCYINDGTTGANPAEIKGTLNSYWQMTKAGQYYKLRGRSTGGGGEDDCEQKSFQKRHSATQKPVELTFTIQEPAGFDYMNPNIIIPQSGNTDVKVKVEWNQVVNTAGQYRLRYDLFLRGDHCTGGGGLKETVAAAQEAFYTIPVGGKSKTLTLKVEDTMSDNECAFRVFFEEEVSPGDWEIKGAHALCFLISEYSATCQLVNNSGAPKAIYDQNDNLKMQIKNLTQNGLPVPPVHNATVWCDLLDEKMKTVASMKKTDVTGPITLPLEWAIPFSNDGKYICRTFIATDKNAKPFLIAGEPFEFKWT